MEKIKLRKKRDWEKGGEKRRAREGEIERDRGGGHVEKVMEVRG